MSPRGKSFLCGSLIADFDLLGGRRKLGVWGRLELVNRRKIITLAHAESATHQLVLYETCAWSYEVSNSAVSTILLINHN